ncbi:MAG: deoxynucleoside kinase [Rikenellaceae bacterium]
MYITIAGNIASGKTSLTELLAKKMGATSYFEKSENPYVGDFYEDMLRWSFNLQIYFLGNRIQETREALKNCKGDLIQDRTVKEDAYIFAKNLHEMNLMLNRDYETYMRIFALSIDLIPKADVMIYLKASVPTLIQQIKKRGRAYEAQIDESYLERLNEKYEDWINNIYKGELITINIDQVDFISNPELLDPYIDKIEKIRAKIK